MYRIAPLSMIVACLLLAWSPPAGGRDASAAHAAKNRCQTKACHKRVQNAREKREWRRYKRHPMPYCTWGPESGSGGQWSMSRYRALNRSSWAGGKFQALPSTWRAFGGGRYSSYAHTARPLHQERVARKILRGQGLGAWVNC